MKWTPGKPIFFDDCYQHRGKDCFVTRYIYMDIGRGILSASNIVWNKTDEDRVVLLFDIWHPELHDEEIEAIVDMFDDAKSKGWLK